MKLREFLSKFKGFDPETELFMTHWIHGDKLNKVSDVEVTNILVSKDNNSELFLIAETTTENTMKGILLR